jgi:apolipoprotein N-acyltransferase
MDQEPTGSRPAGSRPAEDRGRRLESGRGWYWLFVLPFFGTFFPWIYNTKSPELFGLPFFYWYQMAWVPISVTLTVFVYRATTKREYR